jgi:hypothetical protein
MNRILKYKGAFYDLDSMSENDKELLKEEIQKQFPEPKKEQPKEVKKHKTSDE